MIKIEFPLILNGPKYTLAILNFSFLWSNNLSIHDYKLKISIKPEKN